MDIRRDLCELPDLRRRVVSLMEQVPVGRVTTYGDLAGALGDRVASRWIGHFLLNHSHASDCSCHRVVRADGELGRFVTGDVEEKAQLLRADGVSVDQSRLELAARRFSEFRCEPPLRRLRDLQRRVCAGLALQDRLPRRILAGVDISYAGDEGIAAYVEIDAAAEQPRWSTTVRELIEFPYISSYLAFRELPLLLKLLDQVSRQHRLADVLLVDGSGIAHPRRAGIATLLGIVADIPTIGVTKKSLQGRVDCAGLPFGEARPIIDGDAVLGYATLPWPRTRKPIYVSPGHMISVETALAVVQQCSGARKLPTPIYWADRISRDQARQPRS